MLVKTQVVGILKLISSGKKLMIPVTNGKRTIAQANNKKKIFTEIDRDFVNYGCDVESMGKPETETEVYEMVEDGDFRKIFGSFGVNLDLLCLTQDQILSWIEIHSDWLRTDGHATFFLFKADIKNVYQFFVTRVNVRSGGLYVHVFPLSSDGLWYAVYRPRVVVPQLVHTVALSI